MCNLLMTVGVAIVVFGVCFLVMAVGLMLRGTVLRGGCGSHSGGGGCEVCSKKQINLCDSDNDGLAGPAFAATMGRYVRGSGSGEKAGSRKREAGSGNGRVGSRRYQGGGVGSEW